ncbi:MAG TPA: histidine kinase [Puia sp.]|nr:histidine kinase [Puia sp.]
MQSAGDGNSGFYLRGGTLDQNQILLDGATVYDPSHLLGFFSVFNSDAIKDATSLGISRENARLERLRQEKETEHLRTELSFLRTQVNPHFMLTVLNSMVLLARKRSGLLEPVLMELARLMNYMLYDANRELICLEDEIGYLRAYIDLQLLRCGSDVTVRFTVPEPVGSRRIEPMLLIPLVENAFKHGIGLVNLTRRLEMLYPGRYELQWTDNLHVDLGESEHWFIIQLNIPLQ